MGEGTSEIRHLRERVILHDDMLRAIGERIRLLDEMVHGLQALLPSGAVKGENPASAGVTVAAPSQAATPTAATSGPEPRRTPVVRRR